MRYLLLGLLLWGAASAQAASFDCAKASSPVEQAICGDSNLSEMDRRLGKAYSSVLKILTKTEAAQIKQNQRAWVQQRDLHCDPDFSTECLLPLYQQRLLALTFRLSPGYANTLAAKVSGEYGMHDVMFLQVQALAANRLAIHISGAEPTAGRWLCEFAGTGEMDSDGKMSIVVAEDKQTVVFHFQDNHVQVDEGTGTSYYCGMGGTLSGQYRKQR
jgi:uncharacterized protein